MLTQHASLGDAVLEDVGANLVRCRLPLGRSRGVAAYLRQLRCTVERDPAHQLRRDVLLRLSPSLPDALVRFAPDLRRALGLGLNDRPQTARQTLTAPRVQEDRVEHRAEHVVLA